MKLSDMLRFGFAATVVLALILLPSCSAAGTDQGASSSGSRQQPSAPPPRANRYINYLDVDRIAALSGHIHPDNFLRHLNVPFYDRGPIYDTKTDPLVVEQALRDFGVVNIVDPAKRITSQIRYGQGQLQQQLLTDPMVPIRLLDLDPELHMLRKKIQGVPFSFPHSKDTTYLPHAHSRPILVPSSDSLGQMSHAASVNSRTFYYVRPGKEPILVDPRTETLHTTPVNREQQEIQRVLQGYGAAQRKYGTTVASLIWGSPISASSSYQGIRKAHIPLEQYPRFDIRSSKSAMRDALQERGRIRLYTGPPGNEVYKVKVKNPGAGDGEVLQVYAEPLSAFEKHQERLLAVAGKLHLPI